MRSTPWQTSEFPEGSTAAEMPAMKNFDTMPGPQEWRSSPASRSWAASSRHLRRPRRRSSAPSRCRKRQLDRTAALTGEIQARHESNLGFRVAGKVVERPVDVGQRVAAGDLLARLDDQDQRNAVTAAQSDVAAAQAFVEESRTQEERQRKLLADGYTTRTQYDNAQRRYAQAQADLDSAQAKLRSAQDTLSYTELRADRAGVITAKGAEPGQVVASGQMVVRLADPSEREAVFQVPGASLRLEGRTELPPVEVRLVSDPEHRHRGYDPRGVAGRRSGHPDLHGEGRPDRCPRELSCWVRRSSGGRSCRRARSSISHPPRSSRRPRASRRSGSSIGRRRR